MDLTFQVPMQYCSLQHRTLLVSPVTSTTGHIGHLPTWGVPLSVSYLFAFSYCSWGSRGKNTEVVCIPFSSGPHFVRTLTMTHLSWVARHTMAHSFIELDKAQKIKTMVSTPIISWQIDGETMKTVTDYFLGFQNHCRSLQVTAAM